MSLRADLLDAALSTAKAYGHERVERRHVLFAIAKRFRNRPEAGARFDAARRALEPRASAVGMPVASPEATALLDCITTEQDALAALTKAIWGGRPEEAVKQSSGAQTRSSPVQAVPPEAVSTLARGARVENTADILAELDALIGLGPVKAQVRNVMAVVEANTARKRAGLAPVNPSLHLVFTGPPGTGKTTVARLVARLYASTGALPGSGFTEATRPDLVAGYVGQTAIKTTEVIHRTRPGVLFIDEAYALTPRSGEDFGAEAIATLVKAMEDFRDDFAIIVAGYEDEMAAFVGSNPGLRSRFKTFVAFPGYAPAELLRIFHKFARDYEIALAPGVREKTQTVLAEAVEKEGFGHARFVRSLFEQAYTRMAARAALDGQTSVSELQVIVPDDVVLDADMLQRERPRIGFRDG